MRTLLTYCILATVLSAGRATLAHPAQLPPGGFRGPVIGYVLDSAKHGIRPINGIQGSALLGPAMALPFPVTAAGFSPRGDFALVVSGLEEPAAHILRNLKGEVSPHLIEAGVVGADRVVFNSDATVAAFLASDARQMQLVRGLPSSPIMSSPVDLSSIPGRITALAIDKTGSNVLIGVSSEHGALYLLVADFEFRPRLVANFGSPSALVLLDGEQDVVVADAALDEIVMVRDFAGAPLEIRLASARDGVSGPVGLQVSRDGRQLYIANGASRTLDIWNFEAQSIKASLPLDGEPTRLTPLQGDEVFVLNDPGDHPLVLLNAADSLATTFVPASKDQQ